jgi:hypothetical protein
VRRRSSARFEASLFAAALAIAAIVHTLEVGGGVFALVNLSRSKEL